MWIATKTFGVNKRAQHFCPGMGYLDEEHTNLYQNNLQRAPQQKHSEAFSLSIYS